MAYWDHAGIPVIIHWKDRRISARLRGSMLKIDHYLDDDGHEIEKEGFIGHELFGDDKFESYGEALNALTNAVTKDEAGIPLSLRGTDVRAFVAVRVKIGPKVPCYGAWAWLYYYGQGHPLCYGQAQWFLLAIIDWRCDVSSGDFDFFKRIGNERIERDPFPLDQRTAWPSTPHPIDNPTIH